MLVKAAKSDQCKAVAASSLEGHNRFAVNTHNHHIVWRKQNQNIVKQTLLHLIHSLYV